MNNKFVVDLLRSLLILLFQFVGFDNLFLGLFFFIIYKTESECVQMNTVWPIQEAVIHGAGDYQTMKQITLVLISTLWMISSFASLRLVLCTSYTRASQCCVLNLSQIIPSESLTRHDNLEAKNTLTFSILDMVKPVFKPVLLFVRLNDALTLKISWCYTQKMVINNMLK